MGATEDRSETAMGGSLRLLGVAQVDAGSTRMDIPDTAPAYLALYLAAQGDWVPREVLAAYLWPEHAAERAQHNLRVALNRLRPLLERWGLAEGLAAERRRVRLRIDSDLAALRAAVQQRAWLDGLALIQGPFLPTVTFDAYPLLQEWATVERESVRRLWRDCLLAAADAGTVHEELLDRYLRHHPDDIEVAQVRVARATAAGAPSEAAAAMSAFEDADARSAAPGDGALHALRSIRAAVAGATNAWPGHQLLGRAEDIERLDRLVQVHRLVTVTGLPGVGKSSVVQAWSARSADVPVFLLGIGESSTPESLAGRLLRALHHGDSRVGVDDVVAKLAGEAFILAIDGLDQAAGSMERFARFVSALLAGCSDSRIVIASRQPTGLPDEVVMTIGGLRVEPLDHESRAPSAVLFADIARAARPTADLSNAAAIHRVLQLTGGHPLAVRLAASWLRFLSLEEIAVQLQGLGVNAALDTGLEAVVEETVRRLDHRDRDVAEQLAVFASDFDVVSAAAVSGSTVGDVERLVRMGLLLNDMGSGFRLRLHPLVRARLAAALRRRAQWRDTVRRFIDDVDRRLGDRSRPEGMPVFSATQVDPFIEDVLHAWALALQAVDAVSVQGLAQALLAWAEERGAFTLVAKALSGAADVFDPTQPVHCAALATAEVARASLWIRLGDYDAAETIARRAARLARQSGQNRQHRRALNAIGISLWMQMRMEEARAVFVEGLQAAVEADDRKGQQKMGANLALVEKGLGRWAQAESTMREVLQLAREEHAWDSVCELLNNLGNLAVVQNRFDEAQRCHEEAVRVAREHHLDSNLPFSFVNLAHLHFVRGDRTRAQEYVALTRRWPLEPPVAASAFMIEARCFIAAGDRTAASIAALEALEIAARAGDRANQLEALAIYATWLRHFEDPPAGDRLLAEIAASPLTHAELHEDLSRLGVTTSAEPHALDVTLATEMAFSRLRGVARRSPRPDQRPITSQVRP
jgi:tetratricopeptide (TPR) repeat protein/DNA-binding SARP family transcriptional activator